MATGQGIGEFFVSLTVDAASGELTVGNLISSFGELEVATVAEIGALWALGVGIARVVDQSLQLSLGFEQFTMHTGLSAQELQKWQRVAEQSHASANDVGNSVEALTKHLANLAVGIPDSALASLQQIGISPFDETTGQIKDAFQVLYELKRVLGTVTDASQQERILSGLGISPNLRETLLLSGKLFGQRASIAPGMSKEQEAQLDRLRQTMVEIGIVTKQIGINFASDIAPSIEKALLWTRDFARELEHIWKMVAGNEFVRDVVKPFAMISSVGLNGVGDLLNVAAGRGLNVADLYKQQGRLKEAGGLIFDDFFSPSAAAQTIAEQNRAAAAHVTIDKHDTYVIHDAHDPERVRQVIEDHWDDVLSRKTIDGFDRQNNNGGY